MKKYTPYIIVTVLGAFATLTLFLSSSIIFDLFGIREQEGNYVLFVVWANFICGFLYLLAAYGYLKNKNWSILFLSASATILIMAFIGLLFHIKDGGLYEKKTIGALILRITMTIIFDVFMYFIKPKSNKDKK